MHNQKMDQNKNMEMATIPRTSSKRKASCLDDILHQDILEPVLARLPPSSFFRLRAVCRQWQAISTSPTFHLACSQVPTREPWFLMVGNNQETDSFVFDTSEFNWKHLRTNFFNCKQNAIPVDSCHGLVCYRTMYSGDLVVVNPVIGSCRRLPPIDKSRPLNAIAMYCCQQDVSKYRVVLILGEMGDLSMVTYSSCKNAWEEEEVAFVKRSDNSSEAQIVTDETVYFLSKAGDVVASNMQRSPSKQYSSVVVIEDGDEVVYFLSNLGTVVACNLVKCSFVELPRILPVYFEYSIDVVGCNEEVFVVVLSEFLGTASLRVWRFDKADKLWQQVAVMPPSMSNELYGKKADINCVGHGDLIFVCVNSGEFNSCLICNVRSNQWLELPKCYGANGEAKELLAAFSFEPRVEVAV